MSRVLTNNISLRSTVETSPGVPGTLWKQLEPNNVSAFGAQLTSVARRPISATRGRRKGNVVDKESPAEFDGDLTMESIVDFAEGFMFSEFANVEFDLKSGTATLPPPAVSDGYTIDAASALLAGKVQWVTISYGSLVYAKGYAITANNGLKVLTADLATSGTTITVAGQGVVAETPPTSASLQVAGVRVLDDADLTLTVSGLTATLVSAAAITNWATLGLRAGQFIHVGSSTAGGAVQNALGAGGTVSFGYARITSISGATLNLNKLDVNLSTAVGPAGGSQDVMFGRFLRNVPVSADSDDTRYLERTYQIEASYPDLGGVGVDEFEYAIGNSPNELTLDFALADKATATWAFVGTNTEDITSVRKTGASTAVAPLRTTLLNTSSDFAAISTDVITAVSDVCFQSLTLTINNNVSLGKCLGELGGAFTNVGAFEVTLEGQMLFTDKDIVNAVANNTTVTFLTILKNEDGALALDIPGMTFGDGSREFPLDESVLVNITGETFTDPILGYDLGLSFFASVPTIRP